jgi:protein SCO1/2
MAKSEIGTLLLSAALLTVLASSPVTACEMHAKKTETPAAEDGAAEDGAEHAEHRAMLAEETRTEQVSGLAIPSIEVTTQDGRQVDFYRDLVKGKVVAMNFIFTTCTTVCPPMGANFAKLQKILGEQAGEDVHLISVSVDPVTDTPDRLRAWGQVFGAGPGWTLVTGSKTEITRLLKDLQVFTPDITDHSPTVILGNETEGDWTRAYGLTAPADLAGILNRLTEGDRS